MTMNGERDPLHGIAPFDSMRMKGGPFSPQRPNLPQHHTYSSDVGKGQQQTNDVGLRERAVDSVDVNVPPSPFPLLRGMGGPNEQLHQMLALDQNGPSADKTSANGQPTQHANHGTQSHGVSAVVKPVSENVPMPSQKFFPAAQYNTDCNPTFPARFQQQQQNTFGNTNSGPPQLQNEVTHKPWTSERAPHSISFPTKPTPTMLIEMNRDRRSEWQATQSAPHVGYQQQQPRPQMQQPFHAPRQSQPQSQPKQFKPGGWATIADRQENVQRPGMESMRQVDAAAQLPKPPAAVPAMTLVDQQRLLNSLAQLQNTPPPTHHTQAPPMMEIPPAAAPGFGGYHHNQQQHQPHHNQPHHNQQQHHHLQQQHVQSQLHNQHATSPQAYNQHVTFAAHPNPTPQNAVSAHIQNDTFSAGAKQVVANAQRGGVVPSNNANNGSSVGRESSAKSKAAAKEKAKLDEEEEASAEMTLPVAKEILEEVSKKLVEIEQHVECCDKLMECVNSFMLELKEIRLLSYEVSIILGNYPDAAKVNRVHALLQKTYNWNGETFAGETLTPQRLAMMSDDIMRAGTAGRDRRAAKAAFSAYALDDSPAAYARLTRFIMQYRTNYNTAVACGMKPIFSPKFLSRTLCKMMTDKKILKKMNQTPKETQKAENTTAAAGGQSQEDGLWPLKTAIQIIGTLPIRGKSELDAFGKDLLQQWRDDNFLGAVQLRAGNFPTLMARYIDATKKLEAY